MASMLQFFDFSEGCSSSHLSAFERLNEGFDAPRNSFEFPTEASQSYELLHEDIPFSCLVKHSSSKVDIHTHGAPIKKMIDDEISNQTKDKHQRIDAITRLMGMDEQSSAEPPIQPKERRDDRMPQKELTRMTSTHRSSPTSNPINQSRKERDAGSEEREENIELKKPRAREHPQEEALQKFKKDFEAWQASKAWESSRALHLFNDRDQATHTNEFALENLHRENTFKYINTKRSSSVKKMIEPRYNCSSTALETDIHHFRSKDQESIVSEEAIQASRNNDYNPFRKSEDKSKTSDPPKRIVILKPCSEFIMDAEESILGSPDTFRKENDMKEFLEQVKERLKFEIQGKSTFDETTRWHKGDAVLTEHPNRSNQIANKIAEQIRGSVGKDCKGSLVRSESTREYESEFHRNRNNSSQFKALDYRRSKGKKVSYFEGKRSINEVQTRSRRYDQAHYASHNAENVPPRNLLRSYSAPASGTTFGKLLLEDKHVMTAGHIHRKHEASSSCASGSPEEVSKTRKESFNIKSRVSSFRQNFLLKSKIFGRKSFAVDESAENEFPFNNTAMTTPSVTLNSDFARENSTEVPPSPVSFCSSPYNEFYIPGYPSPVSPLDTPYTREDNSLQVHGDPNSNISVCLPECIQLDHSMPSEVTTKEKFIEEETPEIADDSKAFLRDILVTSGLFEGQSFGQVLSGFESTIKPISHWVFNEVEEIYSKLGKEEYRSQLLCTEHTDISSKMLFDLLNEALLKVVRTPKFCSTFKNLFLYHKRVPHGNELLHKLWCQIQVLCMCPVNCFHPLESIVAHDLNKTPWTAVFCEDIDIIAMDMEVLLYQDLVHEIVHDLACR